MTEAGTATRQITRVNGKVWRGADSQVDNKAMTRYQDLRVRQQTTVERPGVRLQVISGTTDGVTGPAENHWPIVGMVLTLDPDTHFPVRLPAVDRAFAYVLEGAATIGGRDLGEGQVGWSDPVRSLTDSVLDVQVGDSDGRTQVMVFSGEPIGEPIYAPSSVGGWASGRTSSSTWSGTRVLGASRPR